MAGKEFRGRQFVPKSQEVLEEQIERVSQGIGEQIVQPSLQGEIFSYSPSELQEAFPVRYDIYVRTLRNQEVTAADTRRLQVLNALDSYIQDHYGEQGLQTLRGRQISVFEDLRNFLEQDGTEGYIKLPTGAGKTVLFTEFVEATDLKTLIVVPTQLLVDQTEERFSQFAESVEVGKVYATAKDYSQQVTVTTYNSFVNNVENGDINPEDYELLILDEAHRSLSELRTETVRKFSNALKIGFTATPDYSEEKRLNTLLTTEIHTMSTREAVTEGVLSPFSVYLAETQVDLSAVKVNNSGEFSDADLEKAVNIASRNLAAVELYKAMFVGKPGVAYGVTVHHAETLANLFNQEGIPAAVLKGGQPRKVQEAILQKYKNGEIQMLCNADILIEGFDEEKVAVCLNLRPTLSPVVAEQRGGRVLRIDPNDPQKHAYIVDFIDKNSRRKHHPITFADVAEAAYLEKRRLGRSKGSASEERTSGGALPIPDIEGLKVTTDAREVMRLLRDLHVDPRENPFYASQSAYNLAKLFADTESSFRSRIVKYKRKAAKLGIRNYENVVQQVFGIGSKEVNLKRIQIPDRLGRELVIDAIFERLFADKEYDLSISNAVSTLESITTHATEKDTIAEHMGQLQHLKRVASSPQGRFDRSQVFQITLASLFKISDEMKSQKQNPSQMRVNAELKQIRSFIDNFFLLQEKHRELVESLIASRPEVITKFFASGTPHRSELFEEFQKYKDEERKRDELAQQVVAKLFTHEAFPYNTLIVSEDLSAKIDSLKGLVGRFRSLNKRVEEFVASQATSEYSQAYSDFEQLLTRIDEVCQVEITNNRYSNKQNRKVIITKIQELRNVIVQQRHRQQAIKNHIRKKIIPNEQKWVTEILASGGGSAQKTGLFKYMLQEYPRVTGELNRQKHAENKDK